MLDKEQEMAYNARNKRYVLRKMYTVYRGTETFCGVSPYMSQSLHPSLSHHQMRLTSILQSMHTMLQLFAGSSALTLTELVQRVESAQTAAQLTKAINGLQHRLWKLSKAEQTHQREHLMNALIVHVSSAPHASLRIEAARWLRLLTQAGLLSDPHNVFATFVTAATRLKNAQAEERREQLLYLTLLFECLCAFHHPYPAYAWQLFPANDLFFPLTALLDTTDSELQEALIAIYAELPAIDEEEIIDPLLPVALAWARHTDAERRRRVTHLLARFSLASTEATLSHLLSDADPIVRASAKSATNYARHG